MILSQKLTSLPRHEIIAEEIGSLDFNSHLKALSQYNGHNQKAGHFSDDHPLHKAE